MTIFWSYSLFGDNVETYYKPLLKNIAKAKEAGVFVIINTPAKDMDKVSRFFSNIKSNLIIKSFDKDWHHKFPKILRFIVQPSSREDIIFYKDSDSVVSDREILFMNHWIVSNSTNWFLIRDHPLHLAPIMAGLLGTRGDASSILAEHATRFFEDRKVTYGSDYSYDQIWMKNHLYFQIQSNLTVYTSYFYYRKEKIIPVSRVSDKYDFIGSRDIENHLAHTLQTPPPRSVFTSFYRNDFLMLPFFKNFSFLFGFVRPTLLAALALERFYFHLFKKQHSKFYICDERLSHKNPQKSS